LGHQGPRHAIGITILIGYLGVTGSFFSLRGGNLGRLRILAVSLVIFGTGCGNQPIETESSSDGSRPLSVGSTPTQARSADGAYISRLEHIVDDQATSGEPIQGSDGLTMADLDQDGNLDFVTTRGNSSPYDGVLWLEQVRSEVPLPSFQQAREADSPELVSAN